MKRASVSIPSNIAEGFTRRSNKEYRQFLYIGLGSASELETQVEISVRLGYIGQDVQARLLENINYLSRMMMNLLKKL